jgi:mannose-1-phosphate guanylyltransferase
LKAFLLAAGHGTRLRPLTDQKPKCLLPINGVPMLQIWLNLCQKHAIDEVLINIHAHADLVTDYVRNHKNKVHIKLVEEKHLLGSAGTLMANRQWVEMEEYFWVFYGDVLTRANLAPMLALHQARKPIATLGVCQVPDPRRCGIVKMNQDGIIRHFVEKPAAPDSNLAFAGLMIGTSRLLDAIPQKEPVDLGFDVLPGLAGSMVAYEISEYLIDIGTLQNYEAAQRAWPSH